MREIPESEIEYIQKFAEDHQVEYEMIKERYDEIHSDLDKNNLEEIATDEEDYWNWVRTSFNSIMQDEVNVPKSDFEFVYIGSHAPSKRGGTLVSESVAIMKNLETDELQAGLIVFFENDVEKRHDLKFGKCYRASLGFDKNNQISNRRFETKYGSRFTKFEECPDGFDWLPAEKVQKFIEKNAPHVPLGESEEKENRSGRIRNPKDEDKTIVNNAHIFRIRVNVKSFRTDIGKSGIRWAKYQVSDASFNPTENWRSFTAFIDSDLAFELDAGRDSLIELYGTISMNTNNDTGETHPQMNACAMRVFMKPNGLKGAGDKIQSNNSNNAIEEEEEIAPPGVVIEGI